MTLLIYDTLKQIDKLKVNIRENDSTSEVWLKFSVGDGHLYTIRFISTDDENDVAIRVFSLLTAAPSQRLSILPVINNLNCRNRYYKFILDANGNINLQYDFNTSCPDPAASAKEMIKRVVKIVNESYPILARALGA